MFLCHLWGHWRSRNFFKVTTNGVAGTKLQKNWCHPKPSIYPSTEWYKTYHLSVSWFFIMDDQQAVQSKKQLPSLWTTTTSYIYTYYPYYYPCGSVPTYKDKQVSTMHLWADRNLKNHKGYILIFTLEKFPKKVLSPWLKTKHAIKIHASTLYKTSNMT